MSDHSVLPFPLYLAQKTHLGGNYVPLTYDCCKTQLKPYPFQKAHQASEFWQPSVEVLPKSPQTNPNWWFQKWESSPWVKIKHIWNRHRESLLSIKKLNQKWWSKQELPMLLKRSSYTSSCTIKNQRGWCHYSLTHEIWREIIQVETLPESPKTNPPIGIYVWCATPSTQKNNIKQTFESSGPWIHILWKKNTPYRPTHFFWYQTSNGHPNTQIVKFMSPLIGPFPGKLAQVGSTSDRTSLLTWTINLLTKDLTSIEQFDCPTTLCTIRVLWLSCFSTTSNLYLYLLSGTILQPPLPPFHYHSSPNSSPEKISTWFIWNLLAHGTSSPKGLSKNNTLEIYENLGIPRTQTTRKTWCPDTSDTVCAVKQTWYVFWRLSCANSWVLF